jgi:hypothetical protein
VNVELQRHGWDRLRNNARPSRPDVGETAKALPGFTRAGLERPILAKQFAVDRYSMPPPQVHAEIGAWCRVAEATFEPGALPRGKDPGDGQDAVDIVAAHQGRVEPRRNHLDHRRKRIGR